jgi:hypothetical protein
MSDRSSEVSIGRLHTDIALVSKAIRTTADNTPRMEAHHSSLALDTNSKASMPCHGNTTCMSVQCNTTNESG